ncbi:MAG: fused MFS/spermidine synthase [ANME-2 cluster archaeon]|nr:fused MFS/spermidine synthase [ANME-2 cluster archaeon]
MAALIYQIGWIKSLSYIFGTSIYASGTVIACFMAGLAIGSFILGKQADKSYNPVKLLGYVELVLGLSALMLILLFDILPGPYMLIHKTFGAGLVMNIMLFLLSFIVLIIPTSLIGGTFPIMNRIYTHKIKTVGKDVGIVYSADTIFAALGAVSAGFILLPLLGINRTIVLAAAVNITVGIYLYRISDDVDLTSYIMRLTAITKGNGINKHGSMSRYLDRTSRVVFLGFFLSGFAALAAEIVWIRFLSLTLGTSIYALSIITSSFLIGLSLGSFIISKHMHRIKYPITTFAFIEMGIGLFAILLLLFTEKLDILYLILFHTFDSFYPFMASLFVVIFLMLLIPTSLMGATMPIVSKIISKKFRCVGTDIGVIYTSNTFGAILGTIFATFVLIPTIGMMKTGALGAAVSIFIGLILFWVSESKWKKKFYSLAGLTIVLCLYMASISINPLFAGAYYHGTQLEDVNIWKEMKSNSEVVHYEEGLYGLVSVISNGNYIALRIDGKTDSSNVPFELVTERQLAYIPLFASKEPKDVMLIGLGGGFTLETITNFDSLETIDVLEINPRVAEVTGKYFSEYNNYALDDPRVNLIIDDGRNHLHANEKKYDVIISQPSNIWLSGEAGLFTEEMYEIAITRLNDGGIYGQWMPLYEQDTYDFKIFVATFDKAFPYTTLWIVGYDAILVGSTQPIDYDYNKISDHITTNTRIKSDFEDMSDVLETRGRYNLIYELAIPYRMQNHENKEFFGSVINTDDHPILEFNSARNSIYPEHTDNPADEIFRYLMEKSDMIITVPFTNLTTRYEDHIDMDFIEQTIRLDDSWKEEFANINVDHKYNAIYMEASYTRGSEQFLLMAFPLPEKPNPQDVKANIINSMGQLSKPYPVIEETEINIDGKWGYMTVSSPENNDRYDYLISWWCDDYNTLYSLELMGVTAALGDEIIRDISCFP